MKKSLASLNDSLIKQSVGIYTEKIIIQNAS